MAPITIIGDIHGDLQQLRLLIGAIADTNRSFVFLGDYVNRGNNSKEVIDFLLQLESNLCDVTFLCGNHDFAFLQYLDFRKFDRFALLGGLNTLSSYLPENYHGDLHAELCRRLPKTHLEFLRRLQPSYENADIICSHAGVPAESPNERGFDQLVLGSHPELFQIQWNSSKFNICGHYPQTTVRPFLNGKFVCLDTGCGTLKNGKLTAMNLPEMQFFQVDDSGIILPVQSK